MEEVTGEILYIFVIGFHHKKGCQIEFSYPEIECLPDEWKHLPSLAMPDGAHNFENDAVYFNLPSLKSKDHTVFGISCFQQIPIEKVKKRTTDMTRGTIQKAICILSTLPLFGYIQIKMELVTAAFFDEGDFSNVSLLKDAYHHLNDCLTNSYSQHLHDGLSIRDLVLKFRHRVLLLFKLLLLEKRVIYFNSPVKPLCCTLLSLISLHPGLIENGLFQSFSTRNKYFLSADNFEESECETIVTGVSESATCTNKEMDLKCDIKNGEETEVKDDTELYVLKESDTIEMKRELEDVRQKKVVDDCNQQDLNEFLVEDYFNEIKTENLEIGSNAVTDLDLYSTASIDMNSDLDYFPKLNLVEFGLPLSIFTEGNFCLPYISIGYLDFLTSSEVIGFHGGASNLLFKQKRQIMDVLVELETSKIETSCPELRRQLFLTTEDLRFGERLIRGIVDPSTCGANSSGNHNSEEWIRMQFALYMLSLLRTSLLPDGSKELEHFNIHFMTAWKNTKNYKIWINQDYKAILDMTPGHPLAGNLSVSDMRLRFSQAMTNTESGRRINLAVATTGRVVGGAITQARGALSNWWSSLTTQESKPTRTISNI